MNAQTRSTARIFVREAGGLRKAAKRLGVSAGALSDIVHGRGDHVGVAGENRVRVALGLAPLVFHTVPACPDCGKVHTGRCHGGEIVVRSLHRRPVSRVADMRPAALAEAIRKRVEV